jgi:hypothetical protein
MHFHAAIMAAAHSNLQAPRIDSVTITGQTTVGSILTAEWEGFSGIPADPTASFEWTIAGVFAGSESTFQPTYEMANVRVTVILENGVGETVSLQSDPVSITDVADEAPAIVNPGTIAAEAGIGKIGYSHYLSGQVVTGDGPPTVSGTARPSRWRRCRAISPSRPMTARR